jgi:inhibitor of KinA sporulation pathway (predicted exonuclease)
MALVRIFTALSQTKTSGSATFVQRFEAFIQTLKQHRRDHYRPERHYMRGPGPKSRQQSHSHTGIQQG